MNLVLLLVSLAAFTAWATWLVALVRRDGLGHREPPRSHHDWAQEPAPAPRAPARTR